MRSCIFCAEVVNSKEDAWPLWLAKHLGNDKTGIIEGQRGKLKLNNWRAGKYPLRIGCVCQKCNNGWMSDLENRAKPIIERFFLENLVALARSDQTTLATWICKSAMVYEALRFESHCFFTSDERKSFRESFQLPNYTSIWIAKSVDWTGLFCSAHDLSGNTVETNDQVKSYVTTMGFGPLAIQIFSGKLDKSNYENLTLIGDFQPGPWEKVTLQIWPVVLDEVLWPNEIGLNGEFGLDCFSQRWKIGQQ
jgi:hypothetical protein